MTLEIREVKSTLDDCFKVKETGKEKKTTHTPLL